MMAAMLQQMKDMKTTQSQTLDALMCMMHTMQSLAHTQNNTSKEQAQTANVPTADVQAAAAAQSLPSLPVQDAIIHAVARVASEVPLKKTARVPDEVKSIITKTMRKAGERIKKNLKAQKRLDTARKDLVVMETAGRYPAGTRPFKCPSELVELDEVLKDSTRNKYVFQVEIPQGTSRREALATLHHEFTRASKKINLEAMEEKVAKEKERNKRDRIMEECAAAIKKATEIDKLDLDDPENVANLDEAVKEVQDKEYGKMVEEVRKDEQKVKEQEEKRKIAHDKAMNELKDNNPTTLMRDVVHQMVSEKVKEFSKEAEAQEDEMMSDGEDAKEDEEMEQDKMKKVCQAMRKNGEAPCSGGKGTWNKTSTKATNKGKPVDGKRGTANYTPWHQQHQHHQCQHQQNWKWRQQQQKQQLMSKGAGKGSRYTQQWSQAKGYGKNGFEGKNGGKKGWYKGNSNKSRKGFWN